MTNLYDERIETISREKMQDLQLKRLQKMIDYCIERVPFYKEKFCAVGITSGNQIRTLGDIEFLPFTTKHDLQLNYPNGFLAVPMSEISRIHASSGTTGKPTVGYYTKRDMEIWSELSARVLCLNGLTKDDIMQISVGYGLFTGAFGFHQGAEKVGCTIVPASTGNTQKQLVMLRDMGVTVLMATPSYATYLSDLIKQSDDISDLKLRRVMLGAERCTKSMRKTIEDNLDVATADNYGLTEFFGPGVAGECECQCGLHISEDYFYPEIIDPEEILLKKYLERISNDIPMSICLIQNYLQQRKFALAIDKAEELYYSNTTDVELCGLLLETYYQANELDMVYTLLKNTEKISIHWSSKDQKYWERKQRGFGLCVAVAN